MEIISNNNLEYELKIISLDDLWVLSEFIQQDDIIFSSTQRKVKIGNDKTKQVTKIIFIELKVLRTIFENSALRITGEIQNETQYTSIGQSHTLTFNPNDIIKLKKTQLLEFEKKLLENSLKNKLTQNLLIILDKDELIACEFNEYSYRVLFSKTGLGSKKYYSTQVNEYEEKYKLIEDLLKQNFSSIIFAGPSLFKDKLQKYVLDKTGIKAISFFWHDVNSYSIQKLIKELSNSGILIESQLSKESSLISLLLENISKNKKAIYGYEKVETAINMGSVEKLFISNKYFNKQKEEGKYLQINNLIKTAENTNCEFILFNSKNEPGKILDGLGGIAGLLRY